MSKESSSTWVDRYWVAGGNSGVLVRGVPYSSNGSSCVRKIMLRNEHIKEPINFGSKITFGIGNTVESLYAEHLSDIYHKVETSVRIETPISGVEADKPVVYLDETDIVVTKTEGGQRIPFEIKSVSSSSKYEKVFLKNEPNLDNVIQAAHHMIQLKSMVGELHYISTIWHKKTHKGNKVSVKSGDVIIYKLEFNKLGQLLVNNKVYPFTVKDLTRWRLWAGATLAYKDFNHQLPEHSSVLMGEKRTVSTEEGICNWCFWKDACYGSENYGQFLDTARLLVGASTK